MFSFSNPDVEFLALSDLSMLTEALKYFGIEDAELGT
jgi:hypothetical protein